jgi:hypothetical protein
VSGCGALPPPSAADCAAGCTHPSLLAQPNYCSLAEFRQLSVRMACCVYSTLTVRQVQA